MACPHGTPRAGLMENVFARELRSALALGREYGACPLPQALEGIWGSHASCRLTSAAASCVSVATPW